MDTLSPQDTAAQPLAPKPLFETHRLTADGALLSLRLRVVSEMGYPARASLHRHLSLATACDVATCLFERTRAAVSQHLLFGCSQCRTHPPRARHCRAASRHGLSGQQD